MPAGAEFAVATEKGGETVVYREGTRSISVPISPEPDGVRLHLGAALQWYGPQAEPRELLTAAEAGRVTTRLIEHLANGGSRRVVVDSTPPDREKNTKKRLKAGRTSAGVLGVLTASIGSATFEAFRSRAAFWPPLAAAAVGAGLTALLLWHATRPKRETRLPRGYGVRTARADDLDALPQIEREAAALFRGYLRETGMSAAAFEDVSTIDDLESAMRAGRLWVATYRDRPVAFAWVELVAGYAHLEEVDVDPAHARRGLGKALIDVVSAWAVSRRIPALTLTTFRDVPWNAPYYERLGFEAVDAGRLSPAHVEIVRDEASRGFDPAKRLTMIMPLRD